MGLCRDEMNRTKETLLFYENSSGERLFCNQNENHHGYILK